MKKELSRILALLLALTMLLALTACGGGAPKEEPVKEEPAAEESAEEETPAEEEKKDIDAAEDAAAQANEGEEAPAEEEIEPKLDPAGHFSLVSHVYNWGSSCPTAILTVTDPVEGVDYADGSAYTVSVWRYGEGDVLVDHGDRAVTAAEVTENEDGTLSVALEMEVAPNIGLAAPYYTNPDSFYGQLKSWATLSYTITNTKSEQVWNVLDEITRPDETAFETGVFQGSEKFMPFASYAPAEDGQKHPVIVWLHGAGSGGTDIGFVTGGMLVTNLISDSVQETFGGAHVLLPQCETWWLDDGGEKHFTADGSSIYTKTLTELIADYVAEHKDADPNRVYLMGCSNGGYMVLNLILNSPDTYAAGVPVCEAYQDAWLTDENIETLKNTPLWFVHSADDPVVDPTTTVNATYDRLVQAGDTNVHYTQFENITDPDSGFQYVGHFAWVPALRGLCSTELDGSPVVVDGNEVTLFQWLALQSK